MAITKLNSLAIPANTVVAADLSYPLTNFSSTGIDDNADATALTISSSEYVGIGTAPIVPLDVVAKTGAHAITMRARSNNDYAFFSMRSYDGTEDLGDIAIQRTAADTGRMLLYTNNGGAATTKLTIEPNGDIKANSGNIVIGTSGKGIDFGATSDGSGSDTSELLDDYEEGTWTPTLTNGVNSISYGSRTGHYTKVGNLVFLDFYIYYAGTGSGAQYLISGLPYAQKNANYCRGGGCSTYQNYGGKVVTFYGNQGTSYIFCYKDGSTSFTSSGTVGNYMIGTFTYQTD